MSIRVIAASGAAIVVLGSAWLLAQTGPPAQQPQRASASEARFRILNAAESVFLLDSASGQTWLFQRRDGKPGWAPLIRWDQKGNPIPPETVPPPSSPTPAPSGSHPGTPGRAGYVRIKLQKTLSGYLTAKARIGGKELTLMLDTGAPNTHLDRERAEKLGLKWKEYSPVLEKIVPVGKGRRYLIDTIALETYTSPKIWIYDHAMGELNPLLEKYGDPPIDGVLGGDILGPGRAIINYETHELFLFKGSSADSGG
jgi:hypothetical protein